MQPNWARASARCIGNTYPTESLRPASCDTDTTIRTTVPAEPALPTRFSATTANGGRGDASVATRAPRPWPLLIIGLGAAVAVWSGWVGLGHLTGFGVVQLVPGVWDDLRINTAVVLPLSVEAYGAALTRRPPICQQVADAPAPPLARWCISCIFRRSRRAARWPIGPGKSTCRAAP